MDLANKSLYLLLFTDIYSVEPVSDTATPFTTVTALV